MANQAQNETKNVLDELNNCESFQGLFDYEITRYVCATASEKKYMDPLFW